jgi:hypothetical protein
MTSGVPLLAAPVDAPVLVLPVLVLLGLLLGLLLLLLLLDEPHAATASELRSANIGAIDRSLTLVPILSSMAGSSQP